jgi:hypothetical protein
MKAFIFFTNFAGTLAKSKDFCKIEQGNIWLYY